VWHFSLRGDGSIDLSKVAQTYGGNGHKSAASFRLPFGASFPFKPLKK
jgi:nanoRNase/pAp phosphatase (c-di-AMP/oligoRNAs hydrolase)